MRDRWYIKLLRESSGISKHGSFVIGKFKLFTDTDYTEYDYAPNVKNKEVVPLSLRKRINVMSEIHKSEVKPDKVIKVMMGQFKKVYPSTIITGTVGGEEFAIVLLKNKGPSDIYFKNDFIGFDLYVSRLKNDTIEKLSDGTYKIHDRSRQTITYCRSYEVEEYGPEARYYRPKDIHRSDNKPAVINYNIFYSSPKKNIISFSSFEFWEEGRSRFTMFVGPGGLDYIWFGSMGQINPMSTSLKLTGNLSRDKIDILYKILTEDVQTFHTEY